MFGGAAILPLREARQRRANIVCSLAGSSANGRKAMKTRYSSVLFLVVGAFIGGVAVQGLHAQSAPSAYIVTEVDIAKLDAYQKEYIPAVRASINAAGGRVIASGQNIVSLDGEPPKTRITITQFDSLDKVRAWRASAQYKDARKIADPYAKFRSVAFEALPQ
jgi:uncharacterized protein (DUF1330 family)